MIRATLFDPIVTPLEARKRVALAGKIARLLDSAFVIPGINKSIGLDPLLGMIPVVGDVISVLIALYIVNIGRQIGMPRWMLVLMLINIALDSFVGTVPVVGDFIDVFWKANIRNVTMMETYLNKRDGRSAMPFQINGKAAVAPEHQIIDVVPESPRSDKS